MTHIWVLMMGRETWTCDGESSYATQSDVPIHAFSTEEAALDFQKADPRLYTDVVKIRLD